MRIHSIEIENITSLKGKHRIDFNGGLHGEELFAITGPTGAGKSSLLSAISLALYGKTYKASLASNDFVTTGQPHSKVSLNFSLAGKDYQANWGIKVLKKNGELIKNPKPQRDLICEGVSLEHTSIADILGLDFDQFCKTIILNQGEFAKFLHSNFRERKDIIEKLYRTQELSRITKILKERVKHEEAELKLQTITFEKALPYSDEEIEIIKDEFKNKSEVLNIHESLTELFGPAYTALKHLHLKLKEEKEYSEKKSNSQDVLKSIIQTWNKSKTQLEDSKNKYDASSKTNQSEVPKLREATKHQNDLLHARAKHKELTDEYNTRTKKILEVETEHKEKSNNLKVLISKLSVLKDSYSLKNLFQQKTNNEIYAFKEDITKLKGYIQEESRIASQEEILLKQIKQQELFSNQRNSTLNELKKELTTPLEELDSCILNLRRKREANLSLWSKLESSSQVFSDSFKRLEAVNASSTEINISLGKDTASLLILETQNKEHTLSQAIIECQKNAQDNQECPVCHSTDLSKAQAPAQSKLVSKGELESIKNKVNKSKFQLEDNTKNIEIINTKIAEQTKNLEKSKNIIFPQYDEPLAWSTESEVQQGIKVLKELFLTHQEKDLKEQEKLNNLKTQIDQINKELQNSNTILKDLKINHQELKSSLNKVKELSALFINNWKELLGENITSSEVIISFEKDNELFNEFIQKDQLKTSTQESLEALQKQKIENSEIVTKVTTSLSQLKTEIESYLSKIHEICGDKNPTELLAKLEKEEKILLKNFQVCQDSYNNIEKLKANEEQSIRIFGEQVNDLQNIQKTYIKKLKDYFGDLSSFENKIPEHYPLQSECIDIIKASNKWIDIPKSSSSIDLLPILEARLETTWTSLMEQIKDVSLDLKTSVHTNKKRIEEYNNKLKGRAEIEKELSKSKESLLVKNRLLEVFGKDEFRSYALGLLEKELVLGANQELEALCDGRYKLELHPGKGGAMEFYVLDQWRESTLRKINTLSGGETFLVSLAMALALAELTRGQNEIDSFFIDEGFGHLDIDSIDEVLEVLMNIQNRGKQIGIISHVKALTDRIPVNLTLQKTTLGESKAEFIYN